MSSSIVPKAGSKQAAGGGAGSTKARGGALAGAPNSAQAARTGNRVQAAPAAAAAALEPRALNFASEEDNSSTGSAPQMDVASALRDMQQQITRLSLEADKWRARAQARDQVDGDDTSSSSGSSAAANRTRIERKQLAVNAPAVLQYDKASSSGALEDWIDGMELLFHQLGVGEDEQQTRLAEVQIYADRDVRRWWSAQREQAIVDNAPIVTWKGFLQVLRAQFLPQLESQDALNELINIRQHAGEAMSQYFLRATRLFARTNGRFADSAAMLIVLDRVRKDEWRHAFAVAQRDVQAGKITTLAQLRACLQREALAEPGKTGQRATQQHHTTQAHAQQQRGSAQQRPQQRVRAAAAAVESGSDSDGGDRLQVAPAQVSDETRSGGQRAEMCARCKKPGHRAQQCTKPDNRKCFVCDEPGHLAAACPLKGAARAPPKNA